jgi:hypothetical protein
VAICADQSTTYLKRLGFNVVRLPQEGIRPLQLVGRQHKTTAWLGSISQLIANTPGRPPKTDKDLVAAEINGQNSSSLKLGIGANVLGPIIGAMGGNLGVNTSYTNARRIAFHFEDVLSDRAAPLAIGEYLRNSEVDADNPVLREYVLGNGELFVITQTVKAKNLKVSYERKEGVAARIDVPAIQGLVGANVAVERAGDSSAMVSFKGTKTLVFGFRCFAVGVLDGDLTLTTAKAGAVPLAAGQQTDDQRLASESAILTDESTGLLDLDMGG